MARSPLSDADRVAMSVNAWVGEPATGKRARGWSVARARAEMDAMVTSNNWDAATPKHFVTLYMRMHEHVYLTPALDLMTKDALMCAASLAGKALRDHFKGDGDEMAAFMRWTWQRQAREEGERRAGTRAGDFRLTWRYQWSPRLVTDYRRACLMRGGNGR